MQKQLQRRQILNDCACRSASYAGGLEPAMQALAVAFDAAALPYHATSAAMLGQTT